ncbi:MAG: YhbY family RNA-binding protein [Nanoarchaeota archaeon]|nr:YhbY family RNA-binding protein [Nanoarchaeota archaeon]
MLIRQMQLGKQGITENFINSLKNQFKNSQVMKISVLKSATRDRGEIIKIKDELLEKLGKNFTARIIGFTIILRKWRKARE